MYNHEEKLTKELVDNLPTTRRRIAFLHKLLLDAQCCGLDVTYCHARGPIKLELKNGEVGTRRMLLDDEDTLRIASLAVNRIFISEMTIA